MSQTLYKNYLTIEADSYTELLHSMDEATKLGWYPEGVPVARPNSLGSGLYYSQLMVKDESPDETRYTIISGSLAPGLSFNEATGTITGTPTGAKPDEPPGE
jgi:hypothetical protein